MNKEITINSGRISTQLKNNKEESKMEEIFKHNLKTETNQIYIQNNHTICFICQKEMSVDFCKTFSCNHLICLPCISKLIIRENFNFWLLDDFKERDYIKVNINCYCGKGNYSTDAHTIHGELNDAFLINKPKGLQCQKHFASVTHYCYNCQKEICNKCIEDHDKNLKKNKIKIKHKIIDIKECQKTKDNFLKEDLSTIEHNISETKKSFIEFASDEKQILVDDINRIITSLNDIKSSYIKSFDEKTIFINKILDFILSAYKLLYKEKEYDIEELSMKNCKIIEGISDTFKKIEFIPKSQNYCEKVIKEIEKSMDNKQLLDFEYKFDFSYINYSSHQELIGHKNAINCLCVLQDRYIVSGSSDHTIKIWDSFDFKDNLKIRPMKSLDYHVDVVNSVLDIDKGNAFISSGRDDKLCLWDLKDIFDEKNMKNNVNNGDDIDNKYNNKDMYNDIDIEYEEKKIFPKKYIFSESIIVYSLCLLSNGKIVISGRDESIKIVDKDLKKVDILLKKNTGPVLCVAEFSEDIIISGGADNSIKIWDLKKRYCLVKYKGHKGQINTIIKNKFNNKRFLSGSSDQTIKILFCDLNDKNIKIECVGDLKGHKGPVFCLLELLDGRIASGASDWTIKIWNLKDKSCVQTLLGHKSTIFSLAQLNDGRLISGEADKLIYIWK